MSRHTMKNTETSLFVYGFDHALGYFYEIWNTALDEDLGPIEEGDSAFGMTKTEFIEILVENKAKKEHILSVVLDLPF